MPLPKDFNPIDMPAWPTSAEDMPPSPEMARLQVLAADPDEEVSAKAKAMIDVLIKKQAEDGNAGR